MANLTHLCTKFFMLQFQHLADHFQRRTWGQDKQMAHMTKAQLAAQICCDDLEMQIVLPKIAKEELLPINRDSCMLFLSTNQTFG